LTRRDWRPFYVGKGRGVRMSQHGLQAEDAERLRDRAKVARIQDIRAAGLEHEKVAGDRPLRFGREVIGSCIAVPCEAWTGSGQYVWAALGGACQCAPSSIEQGLGAGRECRGALVLPAGRLLGIRSTERSST